MGRSAQIAPRPFRRRTIRENIAAMDDAPVALRIGGLADEEMLYGARDRRRFLFDRAAQLGLDHVFVADHVSFHAGIGMDGLVQAALASSLEPRLPVYVGVYLLALRRVVPVARQIATLLRANPGSLVLGIGVGGEDRHEMEVCEIDPGTRGRRTDECLEILRALLAGTPVSFAGEFVQLEDAWIRPAPDPPLPITVGGRSAAAVARAARFGDGWLAAWCSPRRFAAVTREIDTLAAGAGRAPVAWRHGLQLWCGVDADRDRARGHVADAMEQLYRIPFERFERYTPYGSALEVAQFLWPYAESGCVDFNVTARAASSEAALEATAEIRAHLQARAARGAG